MTKTRSAASDWVGGFFVSVLFFNHFLNLMLQSDTHVRKQIERVIRLPPQSLFHKGLLKIGGGLSP